VINYELEPAPGARLAGGIIRKHLDNLSPELVRQVLSAFSKTAAGARSGKNLFPAAFVPKVQRDRWFGPVSIVSSRNFRVGFYKQIIS
jgi:hypothetical protein